MSGYSFSTEKQPIPNDAYRRPITDTGSRSLMLKAERRDSITVNSTVEIFREDAAIPDVVSVQQRSSTYFGPKLQVVDRSENAYLITAPGPDQHLLLWLEDTNSRGKCQYWEKLAEITASLDDSQKNYEICPQCNEPMQTVDHERMASVGHCPNV